jgi:hypothetical protein
MNIGSIVYAGRQRVVSPAVASQKGDSQALKGSEDNGVRGFSKRRGHADFFEVREPFHLVETTASDDADLGIWTAFRDRFRIHSIFSALKIILLNHPLRKKIGFSYDISVSSEEKQGKRTFQKEKILWIVA